MARKKAAATAATAATTEAVSVFVAPEVTAATTPDAVVAANGAALDPHVIIVDGWDRIVIPMNGVRIETIEDATESWITDEDDIPRVEKLKADLERVLPFVTDANDRYDLTEMIKDLRGELSFWSKDAPVVEVVDVT